MSAECCQRVAIVTQCLAVGGTQTYLLGVVRHLTRLSKRVLVVADGGPMAAEYEAVAAELVLIPHLIDQTSIFYPLYFARIPAVYKRNLLNVFPNWRTAASVEKTGAFLVAKLLLKRLGVKRYADHSMKNFRGTGGMLYLAGRLANEFARFGPDMVLTTQLQPTIASLLARRLSRGRCPVHEFIMSIINCMDIPAPKCLHRLDLGDRLLSTTREITEELAAIRPREMILEVGNCVDDEVFAPQPAEKRASNRARWGLSMGDFVIVHMSSLARQKWPMAEGACEAFISFLRSGRRGKFLLIGPGEDRKDEFEAFAAKARSISGQECMFHPGPITTGMEDVLNTADVFVGIGRCIREAMLCEVPAIVYGLQGHPGIIDRTTVDRAHFYNFAGRGCDRASSPENLALEFARLHDMAPEERRELGAWSREFVRRTDSYSFFASQLGLSGDRGSAEPDESAASPPKN